MTWGATNHDASIEKLNRVQGSLTVGKRDADPLLPFLT